MSKAEDRASELHILMWDTDFYNGFVKGYDQAEKDMIEKGIEFLRDHLEGYDIFGDDIERSVESFKLAMKDE